MSALSILIIGSGVEGLMMAAQLLHHGVQPLIVDAKFGPDKSHQLIQLSPRSQELLSQLELLTKLQGPLHHYKHLAVSPSDVRWNIEALLSDSTAFPYFRLVSLFELERVLIQYLTTHACKIRWGTAVENLVEGDHYVSGRLRKVESHEEENFRVDWVIAADGASSRIRNVVGLSSPTESRERQKLLAVELAFQPVEEEVPAVLDATLAQTIRLQQHKVRKTAVFPLQGEEKVLVLSAINSDNLAAEIKNLLLEFPAEVEARVIPSSVQLYFWPHAPVGPKASRRVFLIGEAAMALPKDASTAFFSVDHAFQEAWNLGWKLAGVAQGMYHRKILRSYNNERTEVGQSGLSQPHLSYFPLSFLGDKTDSWTQKLKTIFQKETSSEQIAQENLYIAAKLHVHYRNSPVTLHYSSSNRIKAGDRFPFLPIYHEKEQSWTNTYDVFRKIGLTMVVLGNISQQHLHILGQWIKQKYPQGLSLYYIPYSAKNKAVFDAFEMQEFANQVLIVRPDMHIALMSNSLTIDFLDNYFEEILGLNRYSHFD